MKKGKILLAILLLSLVIVPLQFITPVQAPEPQHIDSTWTEDERQGVGLCQQHQTFYDDTNGYYYAFYCYVYGSGSVGEMAYKSSPNGITWSSKQTVHSNPDGGDGCFYAKAFSVDFNGTHVAYTYADDKHGPGGGGSTQVGWYFRLGHPTAGGTITWDAAEQYMDSGSSWYYTSTTFDSNGYVWAGIMQVNPATERGPTYIFKNSKKDGTWTNDDGFPYCVDSGTWQTAPMVRGMNDGKVIALWSHNATNNYTIACQEYARVWDGSWGAEEHVNDFSPPYARVVGYLKDAVVYNDVVYLYYNTFYEHKLYMNIRSSVGVWSDPYEVDDRSGTNCGGCMYSSELGKVFFFASYKEGGSGDGFIAYTDYLISTATFSERVILDNYTIGGGEYPSMQCDTHSRSAVYSIIYCLGDGVTGGNPHTYEYPIYWIEFTPEVVFLGITITNMEGCGNWVFAEEKYYDFLIKVRNDYGVEYIDTVEFAFSDSAHWINASYNYQTDTFTLESGEDYVNFKLSSASYSNSTFYLNVTIPLYFKQTILDCLDVDIYMWANNTFGDEYGWTLVASNYFNIGNLFGHATLETSGTAGRIEGGDVFEIYAYNNSWAQANVTYRKLQYFHTLFHPWVENEDLWDYAEENSSTIEYMIGIDYCIDDTWLEGWYVHLRVVEGWLATGAPWAERIQWNVTWYYRGNFVRTDLMNSFPDWSGEWTEPAQSGLILDLWFNKINASSTVGGRITAEYYAMADSGFAPFQLFSNNWYIDKTNSTQVMFFDDLVDSSGNIISCKEIKLMRVWARVSQGANLYNYKVALKDFDLFDFNTAPTEMEGVDTPTFVATKTPEMPQTGFLHSLWGAISSGFTWITDALGPVMLGFWDTFVSFLDTVFTFFGWDKGFSQVLYWITNLSTFLVISFSTLIQWMTTLYDILTGITTQMGNLLYIIGVFITNIFLTVNGMYTQINNAYNDTILPLTPVIVPILTLIGICIPFFEIERMRKHGFAILFVDLGQVANITLFIIQLVVRIITLFLNVIGRIIESIPVVE